ncbi:hypothetical protein ABW21_db0205321 [Orbilia brochopaga]|nr:hypothetical protein ABW21_db0205321 [Drechslerella brochopaga]
MYTALQCVYEDVLDTPRQVDVQGHLGPAHRRQITHYRRACRPAVASRKYDACQQRIPDADLDAPPLSQHGVCLFSASPCRPKDTSTLRAALARPIAMFLPYGIFHVQQGPLRQRRRPFALGFLIHPTLLIPFKFPSCIHACSIQKKTKARPHKRIKWPSTMRKSRCGRTQTRVSVVRPDSSPRRTLVLLPFHAIRAPPPAFARISDSRWAHGLAKPSG